jgi:hypothetical protein
MNDKQQIIPRNAREAFFLEIQSEPVGRLLQRQSITNCVPDLKHLQQEYGRPVTDADLPEGYYLRYERYERLQGEDAK